MRMEEDVRQKNAKFWRHWMRNHSLGDLVVMGGAAAIGRLLLIDYSKANFVHGETFSWLVLLAAGLVEGLLIGFIEWKSIRKLVALKPAAFITVTIATAVAGWFLLLSPAIIYVSILSRFTDINRTYFAGYAAIAGLSFGTLMGTAQSVILRKLFGKAAFWIFTNALAWMLSLIIIYSAIAFFVSSPVINAMITVAACLLSGFVQGISTGLCLHYAMPLRVSRVAPGIV